MVAKLWYTRTGSWLDSTVTAVPSVICDVLVAMPAKSVSGAETAKSSRWCSPMLKPFRPSSSARTAWSTMFRITWPADSGVPSSRFVMSPKVSRPSLIAFVIVIPFSVNLVSGIFPNDPPHSEFTVGVDPRSRRHRRACKQFGRASDLSGPSRTRFAMERSDTRPSAVVEEHRRLPQIAPLRRQIFALSRRETRSAGIDRSPTQRPGNLEVGSRSSRSTQPESPCEPHLR